MPRSFFILPCLCHNLRSFNARPKKGYIPTLNRRLPDPTAVVFLLVQAGLVCQWAYDYEQYAKGDLTVGDMYSLVAVQQLCMLVGPVLPVLVRPHRLVKPLVIVALASSGAACLAKVWGYYGTAAVVQGLLLSSVVACLNLDAQPAALGLWQHYACQMAWTAAAVVADLLRLSLAAVYGMAAFLYFGAAILVARKLSPRHHLRPGRRVQSNLDDRFKCLTAHIEDTTVLAHAVSSICLQAVAILTRVSFPGLILESCTSLLDSVGILFIARLCVEWAAFNQGRRASQTSGWRLTSRALGYVLAVVSMAVYFGTPGTALDVCGSHFLVAYAVTLAAVSEPLVPQWQTTAGGLVSSALLLWGCADANSSFDAALNWASVLLSVGVLTTLLEVLAQAGTLLCRLLRLLCYRLTSRRRCNRGSSWLRPLSED